ncbi:hypothetical protein ATY81_25410 [Rhizobium sp. R72]|nr:hypothetical protein ATY81_25410 [Rhizobium sp. R72]OWW00524.1 hypothetical protein ATY80_25410 [Rhizobium sp. R711]
MLLFRRTYAIFLFAFAVIVIQFKMLKKYRNQLLGRIFSSRVWDQRSSFSHSQWLLIWPTVRRRNDDLV